MSFNRYISLLCFTVFASCFNGYSLYAQSCPPNIDFENGDFSGWTCYTGSVASVNNSNVITFNYSGGPVSGRHTMFNALSGGGSDPYGGFAVNCPNGSGHSIMLGNNSAGREAEGFHETIYGRGKVLEGVGEAPMIGHAALTKTWVIRRDHPEGMRKAWDEIPKHVGGCRESVQE